VCRGAVGLDARNLAAGQIGLTMLLVALLLVRVLAAFIACCLGVYATAGAVLDMAVARTPAMKDLTRATAALLIASTVSAGALAAGALLALSGVAISESVGWQLVMSGTAVVLGTGLVAYVFHLDRFARARRD
jgi:hypothetical protein